MKLIYHPKELDFKHLFRKYELSPSDETTLFLLPGVPVVQEIEDYYCAEGIWGNNLLTFNELSDFINEVSLNQKKKKISKTQILSITRKAAEDVSENLEVFREFSQNRDFLNATASIISKLKQSKVSVKEFVESTSKIKKQNIREKALDIGLVYEKYEMLVQERQFLDDSDSIRIVSEELDGQGIARFFLEAKKVVIFGFSDFTLCELNVIKNLSSCVSETFFFLSDFGNLVEYRNCFLGRLSEASIVYEEDFTMMQKIPAPETHIEFRKFRDSHDEVEYVSRTIKKLIIDEGYKASDFKVLVRPAQKRSVSIASIFEKNGVAVDLRNSGTLAESIYGRLAGDILRLKSSNFHRKDLIRFLHNPLFICYLEDPELSHRCFNKIKEISSADPQYRTVSGISGWKRILNHIMEQDVQLSLVAKKIAGALNLISSKFGRKSFAAMTYDLRKIFSELKVSESSVLLIGKNKATRECFDEFFSFIRELSFSYDEFDFRVPDPGKYFLLLNEFISNRTVSYKTPCDASSERVGIIDFYTARGINPKFIFLIGLVNTSFPSVLPTDPVFRPREKAKINQALKKRVFDEESLHYEREKHLFSVLSATASEKVFYSCFDRDQRSNEVKHSDFLEQIENLVESHSSKVCSEEEIFSGEDALARYFSSSGDEKGNIPEILKLKYGSDIVGHLSSGVSAEKKRLELTGAYTAFEGVLDRILLRANTFSPTELETYGTCPFMYFSQRVLKLKSVSDPDEQRASQLELGSLAHDMLKEFMETFFSESSSSMETNRFVEVYEEIRKKYEEKSSVFSHLPKAIAETEKKRFFEHTLPNFISDEIKRIRRGEYLPRFFEKEVEFCTDDAVIRGKVDRVDIQGSNVAVIDYKIGSVKDRKYFDFKNLQLPLYLAALREEGFIPSWGRYLSIGKPADNNSSPKDCSFEEAVSLANCYARSIKESFFPPYVGDKEQNRKHIISKKDRPCSYCDYRDLCRVKDGVTRKISRFKV